ncbi:hypothetical protein FQN54_006281 [Arachnomyces sp. PD_36]|nr:hypothetical protein FQN54_006281 [Arachnomyces sp. PD_36]
MDPSTLSMDDSNRGPKIVFNRMLGWDDHVIGVALTLLIVYTSLLTAAVVNGLGRHILTIQPPTKAVMALKEAYIGIVIIVIGCSLSKTSFAITLLRIVSQKWQIVVLWFIIVTMNLVMLLCAVFYIAQCENPESLWNQKVKSKCWDPAFATNFAIFAGAYSAFMDIVLAMLPWTVILNLQMKNKEKFGVACAMSLGLFAGAMAIVKTSYLPDLSKQMDFTYYCGDVVIWGGSETAVTIVAASIPSLRKLFQSLRSSDRSGSYKYSGSYPLSSSKGHSVLSKGNNNVSVIRDEHKHDDRSDKSILGGASWSGSNIKQTNEILVSYEDKSYRDRPNQVHSTLP